MSAGPRAPVRRPLIFTHGFARFDILIQLARQCFPSPGGVRWFNQLMGDALGYFRLVGRTLAERGFEVHEVPTVFGGSLASRAAGLRRAVERVLAPGDPQAKANIIAHSMGGLDARYMIARLGMADRVASLVTIGTPHLGSSFADWRLQDQTMLRWTIPRLTAIGIDLTGTFDLTTKRCRAFCAFNEAAEAANEVTYISYASVHEDRDKVFWPLRRSWGIIRDREGPNDGLASVASQLWQAELNGPTGGKRVERREFPLPADHLNQCGWWHPWTGPFSTRQDFERTIRDVYVQIAEDLRARGLYG